MSSKHTEDQQSELLNKIIEQTGSETGNDDVAFIKKLRSKFFEEQNKLNRVARSTLTRALAPTNNSFFSVYNDPRLARNARELLSLPHRIVGGTVVENTTFDDCVAILFGGQDSRYDSACTGTLLAKNIVVTAGHCHCKMAASRIFIGNNIDSKGEWVDVARQVPHPDYGKANHNDLMVIVLETEIENVSPRKVASSEIIDRATYARAVGFGNTDPDGKFGYGIKRQVDLPIVSNSCQSKSNELDDQKAYNCDPNLELVAGKPLLEMDTCTGDSGGPLYISDGQGNWLLAGATSRATPNAVNACGDGGIYVRVDKYLDWIRSIADI